MDLRTSSARDQSTALIASEGSRLGWPHEFMTVDSEIHGFWIRSYSRPSCMSLLSCRFLFRTKTIFSCRRTQWTLLALIQLWNSFLRAFCMLHVIVCNKALTVLQKNTIEKGQVGVKMWVRSSFPICCFCVPYRISPQVKPLSHTSSPQESSLWEPIHLSFLLYTWQGLDFPLVSLTCEVCPSIFLWPSF